MKVLVRYGDLYSKLGYHAFGMYSTGGICCARSAAQIRPPVGRLVKVGTP